MIEGLSLIDRQNNSYVESNTRANGTSQEVVAISFVHYQIHAGKAFSISHRFSGVAAGATVSLLLKPITKAMHINFSGACTVDFGLDIYENPTITANGTPLDIVNLNRYSSNVSGAEAYHSPTIVANGTKLRSPFIPGGSGGNAGGAEGGAPVKENSEFIFKAGNSYLIVATNLDGNASYLGLETGHYEP